MEMNLWYEINVTAIRNSLPIIDCNLPRIFVSIYVLPNVWPLSLSSSNDQNPGIRHHSN